MVLTLVSRSNNKDNNIKIEDTKNKSNDNNKGKEPTLKDKKANKVLLNID